MPVIWRENALINAPTRYQQPHLHCVKKWLSYANLSETALYCPIKPEYALKSPFKAWILVIFSKYDEYTTRALVQNALFIWLFYVRVRCAGYNFHPGWNPAPPFRLSLLAIPILWCSCNIKFDSWVSHNSFYLLHFAPYLLFIPYPLFLSLIFQIYPLSFIFLQFIPYPL